MSIHIESANRDSDDDTIDTVISSSVNTKNDDAVSISILSFDTNQFSWSRRLVMMRNDDDDDDDIGVMKW